MAELVIVWILGLIVIAIAWGITDRIAVSIKALVNALAQSVQIPERSRCVQVVVTSLSAVGVLSIMVAAAGNSMKDWVDMPSLLIWAGGLWLIPFRFEAVGHYWLSALALGVILVVFWVGSTSYPSTRTHAQTDVSIQQVQDTSQQGQETSASLNGLGFLFWIALIGLTVAAIAGYTSTSNAVALHP